MNKLEQRQNPQPEMPEPLTHSKIRKRPRIENRHLKTFFHGWRNPFGEEMKILVSAIFGVVFLILGVVVLRLNSKGFTYEVEYTSECAGKVGCQLPVFTIPRLNHSSLFVQYKVQNFQQSHYKIFSSFPVEMLWNNKTDKESNDNCDIYTTNAQMQKTLSVTGKPLAPNDIAIPCGVNAFAYFNDSFQLVRKDDNRTVLINGTDISWKSDREDRFVNIDLDKQWIDLRDERFINWMRTSPYSDLLKTWGRVDGSFNSTDSGEYFFIVDSIWSHNITNLRKSIVLTSVEFYGSPNRFIAIFYIVMSSLSLVFSLFLTVVYFKTKCQPKKRFQETASDQPEFFDRERLV